MHDRTTCHAALLEPEERFDPEQVKRTLEILAVIDEPPYRTKLPPPDDLTSLVWQPDYELFEEITVKPSK